MLPGLDARVREHALERVHGGVALDEWHRLLVLSHSLPPCMSAPATSGLLLCFVCCGTHKFLATVISAGPALTCPVNGLPRWEGAFLSSTPLLFFGKAQVTGPVPLQHNNADGSPKSAPSRAPLPHYHPVWDGTLTGWLTAGRRQRLLPRLQEVLAAQVEVDVENLRQEGRPGMDAVPQVDSGQREGHAHLVVIYQVPPLVPANPGASSDHSAAGSTALPNPTELLANSSRVQGLGLPYSYSSGQAERGLQMRQNLRSNGDPTFPLG